MSTASLPSTQLGVFGGKLQSLPVPAPGPGEVLVQNVAVASNPKDWKYPEWQNDRSYVEGNDIAGFVAAVGPGVTEYKGGERIAAFTKMATKESKYGAYAQYSITPASTTFPLPDSTSFEEAATLPLAVLTAAIGLFVDLGLPEPPAPGAAPLPSASQLHSQTYYD
ncbi:chaperonin 10-like protein [Phellopilus nigrolimitatus]|nr:chaperonin 10-like protein [Phellopilus nigrolimitatus]